MRNTDERKWDDRWYRLLSSNSKVLYGYLGDACDCGGFLEYDPELWSFRTGMSLSEVEEAWKPLLQSGKAHLWVKDGSSMGHQRAIEGIVWVKNAVKIQLGGKSLDTANRFHRGVYRRLKMHLDKFPEIQGAYMAHARVIDGPLKALARGYGKGKGKGKGILGECEGGEQVDGADHPEYSKMIEHGLHLTCKYPNFRQLQKMHPEVDWDQLVDHLVMTHANEIGGVSNAYSFLAACGRKGMFPKGAVAGKPKKVSAKDKQIDEITRRYMAGELTDSECQKLVAKAKGGK